MTKRLTNAQLAFILNEVVIKFASELKRWHDDQLPAWAEMAERGKHIKLNLRWLHEFTPRSLAKDTDVKAIKLYAGHFGNNTCGAMEDVKAFVSDNLTELPKEWYKRQFELGKYKVDVEFGECMALPRATVVFPGEKAALKKLRNSTLRNFKSSWRRCLENYQSVQAAILEFNKTINKWLRHGLLHAKYVDDMDGLYDAVATIHGKYLK